MNYKHYQLRPESLTVEFITEEFEKILSLIAEANNCETSEKWQDLYNKWNALDCYITGEINRVHYALAKDMSNKEMEDAEKYLREKLNPVASKYNYEITKQFLESNHRFAVAEVHGNRLLPLLENSLVALNPINIDIQVKIGELTNRHAKLLSQQKLTIQGKEYTFSQAAAFRESPNPELRQEVYNQQVNCMQRIKKECSEIFDELVKLRHQMALNLGFKNFVELGYLFMERTDYGVNEVRNLRKNILKYIVPLKNKLQELQRLELNTKTLSIADAGYIPSLSLPSNCIPIEEQLTRTQNLFDRLSNRLAEIFKSMVDDELIDLENRPNKRGGGFCTSLPDEGRVAIFLNSTGNSDDVRVIIHEMGHAFQATESQKNIESIFMHWPSYDAAEICSMGMEFISMPLIDAYFNSELADKYRKEHMHDAIMSFTRLAVGDEFQEWIYENHTATIEEREEKYAEIAEKYSPMVEKTDSTKNSWYINGHIFGMPFYYIDYAVAQVGAIQFGMLNEANHELAMKNYMRLCELGGTKSVLELFNEVGLKTPFEEDVFPMIVDYASTKLGV